jgi:hypothetical protein
MGYLHIHNLSTKDQDILLFKECYALEKVHGTSAHISWNDNKLGFFSGGEKYDRFIKLFDHDKLTQIFTERHLNQKVIIYGEAYGGSQQGMKDTYGPELRFIAFDVNILDNWLDVPNANQVCDHLGLEFVPWVKTHTELTALNMYRDAPSEVAYRRNCGIKPREGVVLRPLIELTKNNGERVILKHKGEAFAERKTPQQILDPAKLKILEEADAIAEEWVTPMRLEHVLQKLPPDITMADTRKVIDAMIEDVTREASGEIVDSTEARKAIGKMTVKIFKQRLNKIETNTTVS